MGVQRILWLQGFRSGLDKQEAEVFSAIRHREYDDCRRVGRDNCLSP